MDQTTSPTCRSLHLYWQTVPPTRCEEFIRCWEWFLLTSLDYLPLSRHRHGCNGLSNEDDNDNDKEEDDGIDNIDDKYKDNDDEDDDDDEEDDDNNEESDNDDDDDDDDDNDVDDDVSVYSVSTVGLEESFVTFNATVISL